ncbi:GNAT family N-acetyltransferase [Halobacillus litoralis]|uniref:GNAT family N-acetyltransferase n=1 Tax=Halobacillus litoralis TaxID=45668 RepID=UPI001CD5C848|nr:GNAT family N-acetyltransferase [Halobacillus litoralis]MCA1020756.1 GNAT family N-acetyltransferase [Halobacillus litoralis]
MNGFNCHSVKRIEGEKYITIEDTGKLSTLEICSLADRIDQEAVPGQLVTLMVGNHPAAEKYLLNTGFSKHNRTVFYRNPLKSLSSPAASFTWKKVSDIGEPLFKEIWERSMEGSPNGESNQTMDEHMASVKQELGKGYEHSCLAIYEKEGPVGVAMPHIEPGTEDEGRVFYFGLIPEERGKGKGTPVFIETLRRLKYDFRAACHVGSTSIQNKPMLRLFEKTGGAQERIVTAYKKQK